MPTSTLANALVLAGALVLVAAMLPTRRLISRLPRGPVRGRWYVMLAFVVLFLLGYLGYAAAFWSRHAQTIDLLVPVIFLSGACFVALNAVLSLQTVEALLRLSLLEKENIADPLTGVYNRRYLDRRLNEEVSRARRHGLPLAVLMLDIDHFKRINDDHGHQAGDEVLAQFAALIKQQLREPDVAARYGGEEFLVIAPQTARHDALKLAERLRARIESNTFMLSVPGGPGDGVKLKLTCSIGVASLSDEIGARGPARALRRQEHVPRQTRRPKPRERRRTCCRVAMKGGARDRRSRAPEPRRTIRPVPTVCESTCAATSRPCSISNPPPASSRSAMRRCSSSGSSAASMCRPRPTRPRSREDPSDAAPVRPERAAVIAHHAFLR